MTLLTILQLNLEDIGSTGTGELTFGGLEITGAAATVPPTFLGHSRHRVAGADGCWDSYPRCANIFRDRLYDIRRPRDIRHGDGDRTGIFRNRGARVSGTHDERNGDVRGCHDAYRLRVADVRGIGDRGDGNASVCSTDLHNWLVLDWDGGPFIATHRAHEQNDTAGLDANQIDTACQPKNQNDATDNDHPTS